MCDRLRPLREIKDLDTSELSEEEIDRLMKAQALGLISDGSPKADSPSDDGSDDEWSNMTAAAYAHMMSELRTDGYY